MSASTTAHASRLDPEVLREIIGAYHRCAADTVTRFDGYQQAHENDAEQALRAGLALVDAVGRLQQTDPLRVVSALQRAMLSSAI